MMKLTIDNAIKESINTIIRFTILLGYRSNILNSGHDIL